LSVRELYTNRGEVHFSAKRPILLNGIDDVTERHDLLQRSILLRLPVISEEDRQEEAEFWSQFDVDQGLILGALLDAYSKALEILPSVHLERRPRMADFARWGEAVGRALGWGEGEFLRAYTANIEGVTESAAEASPVVAAVLDFMDGRDTWEGVPKELLAELSQRVGEKEAKSPGWPTNAKKLSNQLYRLGPVLRGLGVHIARPPTRTKKGRLLILTKATAPAGRKPTVTTVTTITGPDNGGRAKDLGGDGPGDGPVTVGGQGERSSPDRHPVNSLSHIELSGASDDGDGGDDAILAPFAPRTQAGRIKGRVR
jgi:hypothetical protein